MNFKGESIISVNDLTREAILHILKTSEKMEGNNRQLAKGKVMASLFFEPSTRTRLSFTSAMEKLGGSVVGFSSSEGTSVKKGETVWDTVKMAEKYSDLIVIRHPLEGAARLAAEASENPVINGGDGANQHPTQTLLDLYTIWKNKEDLENLKIGIVGDLKHGRTTHSLVEAMRHFNPRFTFISPDSLKMPDEYLRMLKENNIQYKEVESLKGNIEDLDILYATRIQEERFSDPIEYKKHKDKYRITKETLSQAKENMRLMHPLPRVGEIAKEVDNTKHAVYFDQAGNGIPIRKALIALVLGKIE